MALRLLAGSPDAVTLEAPLRRGRGRENTYLKRSARANYSKPPPRHLSPFPAHTPFHPLEDLFWFYRSTGCQGDCTTAACRDRRYETTRQTAHVRFGEAVELKTVPKRNLTCEMEASTHSCAHFITDTEIEAALLVHGIIDSREFRKLWPLVLEGIIQQAIVGAEGIQDSHECDIWGAWRRRGGRPQGTCDTSINSSLT